MDSSSWQLRGSFFGFQSAKAKRDLTGSSHFSLKPHKHKLAENKVTAEKQALFKASYIPLWSQKRWKIILLALRLKILHIHKEVIHWLFMDSQRFQRRLKKTHCFLFFCTDTQFLSEHPSLGMIECSSFVAFSSSCTF